MNLFTHRSLWITILLACVIQSAPAQTWTGVSESLDNNVFSLLADEPNSQIFVSGAFLNAGSTALNRIAIYKDDVYQGLGGGTDNYVFNLAYHNNDLYMAGAFTQAGSNACEHIARWDGSDWQPVGDGTNYLIYFIYPFQGDLYAGGIFTMAGGQSALRIARWDGSDWHALDNGLSGGATSQVFCMQEYNGELYVGGQFTDASGTVVNNIARWNGSSWSDVGGGVTGNWDFVNGMTVFNGKLYVAGSFNDAGGVAANGIAVWDGSSWSAPGTGLSGGSAFGVVFKQYHGQLYLGGNFTSVDGVPANNIARFNGINWYECGSGCNNEVDALEILNDTLYAGGAFSEAGGLFTDNMAKWQFPCAEVQGISSTDVSCHGLCDGSASAVVPGSGTFLFEWSNGETTQDLSGLCAGTYTVTITDENGCTSSAQVAIIEYPLPAVSLSGTDPSCETVCNGLAVAAVTGRSPFTFLWSGSPVQTTDSAFALCAGTYYVTVTDSAGCAVIDSISLNIPAPFVLSLYKSDESCPLSCNGLAVADYNSPNLPFTYLWSTVPPQNSDTAFNLCPGTYSVTVTDAVGCPMTDSITVTASDIYLSFNSTQPSCASGGCDGILAVSMNNSQPDTYLWSNSETTAVISSLCPGVYYAYVTDVNGCMVSDSAELTAPVPPSFNFITSGISCSGSCDGTATVTGNPGIVSWSWSNGNTDSTATGLCDGYHTVTVTDMNSCSATDSVLLIEPEPIVISVIQQLNVSCFGLCDGSVSVNAIGGTQTLTFEWNTGDQTHVLINACAGTYTVTATDVNFCTQTLPVTITEPDELLLSMIPTPASCQGCNDGSISVNVSGGTQPYNYFWTPAVPDPNQLTSGWYHLCITDDHACQTCDSAFVDEPTAIAIISHEGISLSISPNPVHSLLKISISRDQISDAAYSLKISDIAGKEIRNEKIFNAVNSIHNETEINVANLEAGIYFISLFQNGSAASSAKFIKQ